MDKLQAMVIEDDYDAAVIMSEALSVAGYEVTVVDDGEKASQALLSATPYLITLDLHLPGIGGEKLLEQIRQDERLIDCYVMLVTADDRLAQIIGDDATLVLLKPISFIQLKLLAERLKPY